jgi:hypothetical protein
MNTHIANTLSYCFSNDPVEYTKLLTQFKDEGHHINDNITCRHEKKHYVATRILKPGRYLGVGKNEINFDFLGE